MSEEADAASDGEIAYDQKTGIFAIRADGTHRRTIIAWRTRRCGSSCTDIYVPRHPRWSPDGKRLAYHVERSRIEGRYGNPYDLERRIFVSDANGKNRRDLGLGHDASWSADGKTLRFVPNVVEVRDGDEVTNDILDGLGPVSVIDVSTRERSSLNVTAMTEFSPDDTSAIGANAFVPLDGSTPSPFRLTGVYRRTAYVGSLRWNHDGRVSYTCNARTGTRGFERSFADICLYDPDTRRTFRLRGTRSFHEMEASRSPTGQSYAVSGMHGLYVTSSTGRGMRALVTNPELLPPTSNIVESHDWRPLR